MGVKVLNCNKTNCFANDRGLCQCLNDTRFYKKRKVDGEFVFIRDKNGNVIRKPCPFYKPKEK